MSESRFNFRGVKLIHIIIISLGVLLFIGFFAGIKVKRMITDNTFGFSCEQALGDNQENYVIETSDSFINCSMIEEDNSSYLNPINIYDKIWCGVKLSNKTFKIYELTIDDTNVGSMYQYKDIDNNNHIFYELNDNYYFNKSDVYVQINNEKQELLYNSYLKTDLDNFELKINNNVININ